MLQVILIINGNKVAMELLGQIYLLLQGLFQVEEQQL